MKKRDIVTELTESSITREVKHAGSYLGHGRWGDDWTEITIEPTLKAKVDAIIEHLGITVEYIPQERETTVKEAHIEVTPPSVRDSLKNSPKTVDERDIESLITPARYPMTQRIQPPKPTPSSHPRVSLSHDFLRSMKPGEVHMAQGNRADRVKAAHAAYTYAIKHGLKFSIRNTKTTTRITRIK